MRYSVYTVTKTHTAATFMLLTGVGEGRSVLIEELTPALQSVSHTAIRGICYKREVKLCHFTAAKPLLASSYL